MATYLMALYVVALLATVLYSGSRGLDGVFGFSERLVANYGMSAEDATFWATVAGAWFIGIVAAVYTIYGGLKAVVWSDLIQGAPSSSAAPSACSSASSSSAAVSWLDGGGVAGGSLLEGWRVLCEHATTVNPEPPARRQSAQRHSTLERPDVPWLAVFVGGLWIPNLFYWGMNQFITQRTLGAKSLAEGQRGIFLACFLKLIIPFIIVIPGIIAFQVFGAELLAQAGDDPNKAGELAYPYLIKEIMPPMLRGVMLAALAGAVMSTFNSGINSASTIFTIDIYRQYLNPQANAKRQVYIGRIATAVIALFACLIAPLPGQFAGVFSYIQEIWGFISPGHRGGVPGGAGDRGPPRSPARRPWCWGHCSMRPPAFRSGSWKACTASSCSRSRTAPSRWWRRSPATAPWWRASRRCTTASVRWRSCITWRSCS
jgi:SSS family solute:Na+ symporter